MNKIKHYEAVSIALPPTGCRNGDPTVHWTPVVVVGELVAGAQAAVLRHEEDATYPLLVGVPVINGRLTSVEPLEHGAVCVTSGSHGWLLVPLEQPQSSERRDAA